MSDRANPVVPFPSLHRRDALNRVRQLAKATFNIHWTEHALARLDEREITMRQALSTLRQGDVDGNPVLDEDGSWKLVLLRRSAGMSVRLVVALDGDQLYVVTAI